MLNHERSAQGEVAFRNVCVCVYVCVCVDIPTQADIYTISPGSWGSMAKSRPATAARGPQARGLSWRAEMQPNCPVYQERLCLSSWNRYSTRTGKARKNRTRKESFLARKTTETFSHVRLQISALGRRFAISHGSNQLIQCWRSKFRSKVQGYM